MHKQYTDTYHVNEHYIKSSTLIKFLLLTNTFIIINYEYFLLNKA